MAAVQTNYVHTNKNASVSFVGVKIVSKLRLQFQHGIHK